VRGLWGRGLRGRSRPAAGSAGMLTEGQDRASGHTAPNPHDQNENDQRHPERHGSSVAEDPMLLRAQSTGVLPSIG